LAYKILFSDKAQTHLGFLTARQRSTVLDAVDVQLKHEPTLETRNRKPLRPNPLAQWELRIGELRVYYRVEDEPQQVVYVLLIGVKDRNIVRVGSEVLEL
jgi:mRNA-degrading endonuclease RelE of RelBE toxin-antitoxin system